MENKTVGFACGAMDLLHAGHVLMLEECSRYCDYLIVGLHTNPNIDRPDKNKPVQSLVERYIQLSACKYVDEIVPYETEQDLLELLKAFPIDVRFVGMDWKDKPFTGHEINSIDVIYTQRDHDYSSSGLRSTITSAEHERTFVNLAKEESDRDSLYGELMSSASQRIADELAKDIAKYDAEDVARRRKENLQ